MTKLRQGAGFYITEHGAASDDEKFRERDLRENLTALHGAMTGGVEVRGFFYWSLLDNFEWQFGYTKKFGLLAMDFADETLPRTMKPLAKVYSEICREIPSKDEGPDQLQKGQLTPRFRRRLLLEKKFADDLQVRINHVAFEGMDAFTKARAQP